MSTLQHPASPPSPAATVRPVLGGLRAERMFLGRSLRHSLRDPESMIMAIGLPVLLMAMFTWVFGGAIDSSGQYVNYVVPGIILTCAGFGAASTSIVVATDMQAGIIDRFRTMPLRAGAVLTGHVLASLLRNLVATAIVVGVALLLGFRPEAQVLGWVVAAAIIALWILAITALFAAIGLAARSPESANGYGFILLFLPYLSSGFVPVETMPQWLRPLAEHQPATPLIETIRGLLMGTDPGSSPWVALVWCAVILLVAAGWGRRMFRRRAGRR